MIDSNIVNAVAVKNKSLILLKQWLSVRQIPNSIATRARSATKAMPAPFRINVRL